MMWFIQLVWIQMVLLPGLSMETSVKPNYQVPALWQFVLFKIANPKGPEQMIV